MPTLAPTLRLVPPQAGDPPDSEPHLRQPSLQRLAARSRGGLVFLEAHEAWAFQATRTETYVHCQHGKFEIDLSLDEVHASFCRPLVRVHAHWLVDLSRVRAFEPADAAATLLVGAGLGREGEGLRVPVSRELTHDIRERLLVNATGLRRAGTRATLLK